MLNIPRSRIRVFWARWGIASRYLASRIVPQQPSLLVLSLPRSGSSWVGEVLGNASNALYLREPVTQSNMKSGAATGAVIDINPDAPPQAYRGFCDAAFSGLPAFHGGITRRPEQWRLRRRLASRLVIKEVNPLACEWFAARYRPRIIYLVRHPAAVALSYWKLGWTNDRQAEIFGDGRLLQGPLQQWLPDASAIGGFWRAEGVRQGAILYVALMTLRNYPDCRIVSYEELCRNPVDIFRSLFDFSGLQWDDAALNFVEGRSSGAGSEEKPYGTARNSSSMIGKWKDSIDATDLAHLRSGYEQFELPWYKDKSDW